MTIANQNFVMTEGEYKEIIITVLDENGDPQDLSNCTGIWKMEQVSGGAHTVTKTTASGMSFGDDPTLGVITITLEKIDTNNYDGVYNHECRVFDASSHPETVCSGQIRVDDTMFELV